MTFPNLIPITDLVSVDGKNPVTHMDFNAATIQTRLDFYRGGESFPLEKHLWKRPIEDDPKIGKQIRKSRVSLAYYSNNIAPNVWDMIGHVCADNIEIESEVQTDEFWQNFSANADGAGTSVCGLIRSSLENMLVLDRAFYLVTFPESDELDTIATRLSQPVEVSVFQSECVRDWTFDSRGGLSRIRIDGMTTSRPAGKVAGEHTIENYVWTFYDFDGERARRYTYTAQKDKDKNFDSKTVASLESVVDVGSKMPVFCAWSKGVGLKLVSNWMQSAIAIFNAQSDRRFFTSMAVTMAPYFTGVESGMFGNDGMTVGLSPLGGLALPPGVDMKRDAVPFGAFEALDSGVDKLKAELTGIIQTGAKQAATQAAAGQNTSRMTGKAAESHSKPYDLFIKWLSEIQYSTWKQIVEYIGFVRGDSQDVTICGLNDADADDNDHSMQISDLLLLRDIPEYPRVAIRAECVELAKDRCELTPELEKEIENEIPISDGTMNAQTSNQSNAGIK